MEGNVVSFVVAAQIPTKPPEGWEGIIGYLVFAIVILVALLVWLVKGRKARNGICKFTAPSPCSECEFSEEHRQILHFLKEFNSATDEDGSPKAYAPRRWGRLMVDQLEQGAETNRLLATLVERLPHR